MVLPSENATLTSAGQYCNQIVGKTIRQAWELSTGEVQCEFEGPLSLKA